VLQLLQEPAQQLLLLLVACLELPSGHWPGAGQHPHQQEQQREVPAGRGVLQELLLLPLAGQVMLLVLVEVNQRSMCQGAHSRCIVSSSSSSSSILLLVAGQGAEAGEAAHTQGRGS
jgi:hypothetical protein